MKYAQGSFITVPSREALRGLHPTAQTLYMWLCSYANETGNCFPSRETLANNVGCSQRTIDAMIDVLEEKGLLKKTARFNKNEQTTNLYTVMVIEGCADSAIPLANPARGVASSLRTELNPSLTQSIERGEQALKRTYSKDSDEPEKKTPVIPSPYSIENTRTHWQEGTVRLQLLDWYFKETGLWGKATTRAKLQAIMLRHSKAAERIEKAGWTFGEVKKARAKIADNDSLHGEWTLETVEKYLTK